MANQRHGGGGQCIVRSIGWFVDMLIDIHVSGDHHVYLTILV